MKRWRRGKESRRVRTWRQRRPRDTRVEKNISGGDSQASAGTSTHTYCRKSLTSPLITISRSNTHTHTPIKEACTSMNATHHDQKKDSWHAMSVSTPENNKKKTFSFQHYCWDQWLSLQGDANRIMLKISIFTSIQTSPLVPSIHAVERVIDGGRVLLPNTGGDVSLFRLTVCGLSLLSHKNKITGTFLKLLQFSNFSRSVNAVCELTGLFDSQATNVLTNAVLPQKRKPQKNKCHLLPL